MVLGVRETLLLVSHVYSFANLSFAIAFAGYDLPILVIK